MMFVVVLMVAAALFTYLFSYFQAENRKRAEVSREEAEQVLEYIIVDLQGRLTDLGGRALLDDIQKQVDAYYKRMGSVGESDKILRRKAVSYDNQGNLFFNRGNLDSALTSYQSALAIRAQLATRDAANTQWQTDLVVSLYKIATVLEKQSSPQKKEAATKYQRILDILRPLAAANRLAANQQDWIADVEKHLEALKE